MECPGLNLHRYYEDDDITKCYTINPKLLMEIEKMGWRIGDKLAEGSTADVFNITNTKAVLIIFGNADYDFPNINKKLEIAKLYPNIFPRVYDYFNFNIPYSNDTEYINSTGNFGNKTIQIIEKMDMTLDEYLIMKKQQDPGSINKIINKILITLSDYLNLLYRDGYEYTDLKLENVGVSNDNIKLLDIEGLRIDPSEIFDIPDRISPLYKYEIIPLLQ